MPRRDAMSRGLTLDDMYEGDILVMLGPTWAASLVCCCGRSWGSSHVGQVMRLGGQLWLAESTPHSNNPNSNFSQWVRPGSGPVHDGVCATKINDSLNYYAAIDIYRPIGVTPSQLQTMRTEFLRLYGSPYQRISQKLMPICFACDARTGAPIAYDCSDLTYHLFDTIGHATSDANIRIFGADFVRPYDIPRVIACDRIGHADGVYAIGDSRSFLSFMNTRVPASTAQVAPPYSSCVPCVASTPFSSPVPPHRPTCTPIGPTSRSSLTRDDRLRRYGVDAHPIAYPTMHRI